MRLGIKNPMPNGRQLEQAGSVYGIPNSDLADQLNHLAHPQEAALFVAKPQMSDVHQGASGQCFIDAALLSIIYRNPYFLTSILHKEGDILSANLYRRDNDGSLCHVQLSIEHSDFQPPAAAQFHSHAAWVSSLVKAYGIMRAKFYSDAVAGDGKLKLLPNINEGGQPADVFAVLTGRSAEVISISQHEEQNLFAEQRDKNFLALTNFFNAFKANLNQSQNKAADAIFSELVSALENLDLDPNHEAFIRCQLTANKDNLIKWIDEFIAANEDEKTLKTLSLIGFITPERINSNSELPEFFLAMAQNILNFMNDEHQVHLTKIDYRQFTPDKTPKVRGTHYDSKLKYIFAKIEDGLNKGSYLTASTEDFTNGAAGTGHAAEKEHCGLVGLHAYALLGTCRRRDAKGQERYFVRLKNPWQQFTPEYTEDGLRQESRDSKGLATREYEQTKLFGAKSLSSSDSFDPQLPSLSSSANGVFELELGDFCRHFTTITVCENTDLISQLLHDLQAFLANALNYIENEDLRNTIANLLENFDAEWKDPQHLISAIYNELKRISLPENYNINELIFVEFCCGLKEIDGTIGYQQLANSLKNYSLESHEKYGYSEKVLLDERLEPSKLPANLRAGLQHIKKLHLNDADKLVQIYFYLASCLRSQNSDEDKETLHQLLSDIRQHWKSRLHECSHLLTAGHNTEETKRQRDFYSYLNDVAFDEARKIIENEKSKRGDHKDYREIAQQVQAHAKLATKPLLLKLAAKNPWNMLTLALAFFSIVAGIALQFSGVGAPVGLLMIKAGYTKLAAASAARIAILNASFSIAASAVLGSISKFFTRSYQYIKQRYQKSRHRYKALPSSASESLGSSPKFSPCPSPGRNYSLQAQPSQRPISQNRVGLFCHPAQDDHAPDNSATSYRRPSPGYSSGEE